MYLLGLAQKTAEEIVRHWPGPPWTPDLDEDGVWDGTWSVPNDRELAASPDEDYAGEFAAMVAHMPHFALTSQRWAPVIACAKQWAKFGRDDGPDEHNLLLAVRDLNATTQDASRCDPPHACTTHGRCWTHSDWDVSP